MMLTACLMAISAALFAQSDSIPVRDDQVKKQPPSEVTHHGDFGIGLGLDYGGLLGVQIAVVPIKHLSIFAAGGYYFYQFGWNVGMKLLFISKTSKHVVRPFLKGMYGCNSIIMTDKDEYNKVYKGFTVGLGLELRFGHKKKNGFDFDLNVPLRTPDFWIDYNRMKDDPSMEVTSGPIPVAFSFGFHHEF
jgi:hypothetical protein